MAAPQSTMHNGIEYGWVECLSDLAGGFHGPGFWADLWVSTDGKQIVTMGGPGWKHFTANAPQVLTEADAHFVPFIAACGEDTDLSYAIAAWGRRCTHRRT